MNKQFYISTILALLLHTAGAQTYFSRMYGDSVDAESVGPVVVQDGYIYSIGRNFDNGGFVILKTDLTGDPVFLKTYSDGVNILGIGGDANLIYTTDGNFVFGGGGRDTAGRYYGHIVKFNSQGDTLWVKPISHQDQIIIYGVSETSDRGFVATGVSWLDSINETRLVLIKTDSLGNQQWSRNPYIWESAGFSVNETPDGGFLIGAIYHFSNGNDGPYVVKTNITGVLSWYKTYSYSYDDIGCVITPLADGNYLLAGAVKPNNGKKLEGWAAKMTPLGDTLWAKSYGTPYTDFFQTRAIELPDKRLIFLGMTGGFSNKAWLLKLTSDGDSIWSRQLNSPYNNANIVYDFKQTPDGGFIIAGSDVMPGGSQDAWLLKVDSLGCPYPNCAAVATDPVFDTEDKLSVYPNPGKAWFAFTGKHICYPAELTLRDIEGREVLSQKIFDGVPVNTIHLPAGMFHWQLTARDGERWSGNWVKVP